MGDGDGERSELGSQDLGKCRECRADGRLGGVERRVDRRDDGGCEDHDFWRVPLLADGGETGREEGEEGLDGEDRVEKVSIEEVGKARRRDGGDGRGLVVKRRDEDDRLERKNVGLRLRCRGVWRLKEVGESVDGYAGLGRLSRMEVSRN